MKKLLYFTVLISMILQAGFLSGLPVSASDSFIQDGIRRGYHSQTGKLSFLGADPSHPVRVERAMERGLAPETRAIANLEMYAREFGIRDASRELRVMRSSNVDDRLTVKYQQVYNDIPVMAGELIVNMKGNGGLLSINGEVSPDMKLDTLPKLSAEDARQRAVAIVSQTYKFSDDELTVSEPELWIFDERLIQDNATQPVHLVWRMEVASENAPLRELVLVNAKTGMVSLHFNQIDTAWSGNDFSDSIKNFTLARIKTVRKSGNISISKPAPALGYMIFNAPIPGSDLFVATLPTGSDANDCLSPATPCATINAAIGKASANQTIYIAEGTYMGSGTEVVKVTKSLNLSGGWNLAFTLQTGYSVVDAEFSRRGLILSTDGVPATLVISRFIIMNGRRADYFGGGIAAGCSCYSLTVQDSAVINNTARSSAGIYASGNLNLYNVTVSNNRATDTVGGVSAGTYYDNISNFENSTISNNTAARWTAGISGNIILKNTIISDNTTNGVSANCGWLTSHGYNIIDDMTGCSSVAQGPGDQFGEDPKLNVLIPDKGYHPLLNDSPARNAGNACTVRDQRGIIRDTPCDIGAYEYTSPEEPSRLVITDGNNQRTPPNYPFAKLLQVTVLDHAGSPIEEPSGIGILLTAPDNGAGGMFADSGTNITTISPNSNGVATASVFTASNEFGAYQVVASSDGLGSVNFSLENSGLYVVPAPEGNDSNSCKNPSNPCATIVHAIDLADNGDVIFVAEGTYAGYVVVDKDIALTGGWNSTFSSQVGFSIIDGEGAWRSLSVYGPAKTEITRFILENGRVGPGVGGGGGVGIASSANVVLTNVIVRKNQTDGSGGGIENGGTLIVNNSAILENTSKNDGGGIANYGTLFVNNTTISNNNVVSVGGGVWNYAGTATLNNVTIASNRGLKGGGIYSYSGSVIIQNSILDGNDGTEAGPECSGNITSLGNNILKTTAGCAVVAVSGDQFEIDSQIGPLVSQFGFHTIAATSPAKDAGNISSCESTDQRGVERFGSDVSCDIGAIEISSPGNATHLLVSTGTGQYTLPGSTFVEPLSVVVLDAGGDPIPGQTIRFAAPANPDVASGIFSESASNTVDVISDPVGVATAPPFTANDKFGSYVVVATLQQELSAEFVLENAGWFVSSRGLDTNDCKYPTSPCLRIQTAVDKAQSNETIFVTEGTYTDSNQQVVNITKNITLSGGWDSDFVNQAEFSTIDGDGARAGMVVAEGATAIVQRFAVRNSGSDVELEGGGIKNYGKLTLVTCKISENNVDRAAGAGVYNSGVMVIRDCVIEKNYTGTGYAAIYNNGWMTISDSFIRRNKGSGVYNEKYYGVGILTIRRSVISENLNGAGAGILSLGTLTVSESSISNNQGMNGSGLYLEGDAVIVNSTISGNVGSSYGGGIYFGGVALTLRNDTISENLGFTGGGIYRYPDTSGRIYTQNTILGNNKVLARGIGPDCNGTIVSRGYNIVSSTSGCTIARKVGDQFNVDPKLGVLIKQAGYQPIGAGSPAVNSANPAVCPATDQRGVSRVGVCDIGAYEYKSAGPAAHILINSGDDMRLAPNQSSPEPLQVAVLDQNGTPVSGVRVTFRAPSSGPSAKFDATGGTVMSRTTDAAGLATSSIMTANGNQGPYIVTASADVGMVYFDLTNLIWHIAPGGDDGNDCLTPSTPCASISRVIERPTFFAGNTIWMASGMYDVSETGFFDIEKSVTIIGGWSVDFTARDGVTTLKGGITMTNQLMDLKVRLSNLVVEDSGAYGFYNVGHDLVIENSTIRNNSVGVVNSAGGHTTIINTTISGSNASGAWGGGVISEASGLPINKVTLINTTVVNNFGGGVSNETNAGAFYLVNSIFIGNKTIGGTASTDCSGTFISSGHNIIGNIGVSILSSSCKGDWSSTDQIGITTKQIAISKVLVSTLIQDPVTGQWYHPLKLGSLALEAGNTAPPGSGGNACPSTDQLGIGRPVGVYCDVGAVEYQFSAYPAAPLLVTYTANHTIVLPGTLACSGNDAACTGDDEHVIGAHQNAFSAYSKYLEWHDRDSIDGNGMQIDSTVRYGNTYKNAFWNGHMLVYGDGYGFPLADDVVAHEFTHGVTQYESNLFYWYQSGAINESFSDLWGEAVDQTNGLGNDTASVKWLIGEDVTDQGAVRNMARPPAFYDPDSMASTFYCKSGSCLDDNGGVHTNSGVNNKAVYLMVNGGTFGGKTVPALGWLKVLTIYYEAQTNLLTSGADYLDLSNSLYQACTNKIGSNGITNANCTAVRNATLAVKMNQQPVTNFNPDAPYCPTGTSRVAPDLFYEDFETGTNGWTIGKLSGLSAWGLSGENARKGLVSLWADDSYEKIDAYASTKGIFLPVGSKPYLHFSHTFKFETVNTSYFDGGVLEYSINNGMTWVDASSLYSAGKSYDGKLASGYDNPLQGRSAFVGDSHGFVDSRYILASFAGKTIRFRWRIGTDSGGSVLGWYLDEVRVYRCVSQ